MVSEEISEHVTINLWATAGIFLLVMIARQDREGQQGVKHIQVTWTHTHTRTDTDAQTDL